MENECSWYDPSCALKWLADELKAFFLWLYDSILSGFAALLEMIPVPEFMANVGTFSLPSGVAYFASAFELPFAMGVIVAAYTARFILRRIPVIG